MEVWSYKLSGSVRSINILNHYVGMKAIEEADFWELRYFPYILGSFALLAVLTAVFNLRRFARLWAGALVIFSVGALVDFYIWEYKFGHDLNPDAAIKMEDTAYQPPFIGSQTILNITARSLPGLGSYGFGAGVFLGVLAVFLDWRRNRTKGPGIYTASIVMAVSFLGCNSNKVEPILFGQDTCSVCHMNISDRRFGFEVRTDKGKLHKFDSYECYYGFKEKHGSEIAEIWVVDSFKDGALISVRDSSFVRVEGVRGPMGGVALFASADRDRLGSIGKENTVQSWDELVATPSDGSHGSHDHMHSHAS